MIGTPNRLGFAAVSVGGAVMAGLLALIAPQVASAIPSFDRTTRADFQPGPIVRVLTGRSIDRTSDEPQPAPKTLTKLVVRLPAGSRYTPSATPRCSPERCTRAAKVGVTYMDLVFPPPGGPPGGLGLPCHADGSVYNNGRNRLLLSSVPDPFCTPLDRSTSYVFRGRFTDEGQKLIIDVVDGPVEFFVMTVRRLLKPPARCPESGRWAWRVVARYDDDTIDSVVHRQRCRR